MSDEAVKSEEDPSLWDAEKTHHSQSSQHRHQREKSTAINYFHRWFFAFSNSFHVLTNNGHLLRCKQTRKLHHHQHDCQSLSRHMLPPGEINTTVSHCHVTCCPLVRSTRLSVIVTCCPLVRSTQLSVTVTSRAAPWWVTASMTSISLHPPVWCQDSPSVDAFVTLTTCSNL